MRDVILAIDQGTTGSTAVLMDRNLDVLASANREFPQIYPRPGLVERDPGLCNRRPGAFGCKQRIERSCDTPANLGLYALRVSKALLCDRDCSLSS